MGDDKGRIPKIENGGSINEVVDKINEIDKSW